MKRLIFAAAVATLLSPAAFAQTNSTSGSQSGAVAIIDNSQPSVTRTKGRLSTTASAIAPGLTAAGVHSCAGSTSAAGGGTGFGFSFGTTYEMQECNRRAYAATLMGMGQNAAALALVCNNPEVQNALNLTGVTCPQQRGTVAVNSGRPVAPVVIESSARGAQGSTVVPARSARPADSWSSLEAPVPMYNGKPIIQTATPWRD